MPETVCKQNNNNKKHLCVNCFLFNIYIKCTLGSEEKNYRCQRKVLYLTMKITKQNKTEPLIWLSTCIAPCSHYTTLCTRYSTWEPLYRAQHMETVQKTAHGNSVQSTAHGNCVQKTAHGNCVQKTAHGNSVWNTAHSNSVENTAHGNSH